MKYYFLLIILFATISLSAQKRTITLGEAIDLASQQSIDAFRQKNMYLARYWEYRYYKADMLPSLSLNTNPVKLSRATISDHNPVTDEDFFRKEEVLRADGSLELGQNLMFTGGRVSVSSDIGYLKNFNGKKTESFNSVPISITLNQPLNGYNQFKWRSKIEPLKYEKAKRQFILSKEQIAINATNHFFNLISAQINKKIAETNLNNADTLFKIGQGRFKVGTMTKDELLNLELTVLNSRISLSQSKLNLKRAQARLNSYLGFGNEIELTCLIPDQLPALEVNSGTAIDLALTNNPKLLQHKQDLLQQDQRVSKAEADRRLDASIYASVGMTKSANSLNDAYKKPQKTQRVNLGLKIPIFDWGYRKGELQKARSEREVERATVKQERIDFEQDVFMEVMEFNLQDEQVISAAKADTIAQIRYDVTQQRFLIGKVDVTKLNIARNDLDKAKNSYIDRLRVYWRKYYTLRRMTLYDFEKDEPLTENFERLIQEM